MQKERKEKVQGNGSCIFDYDYKKQWYQNIRVDKVTEFAGEF